MKYLPAFLLLWNWLLHLPAHVDTYSLVLDTAYFLENNCSILLYLMMPEEKEKIH